ncbi:MFS transporter [Gracilibacillus phocaeensis]|uniref:MFS transporter n=1 Tax=Gracilibacillus phocaeensis TaxID=2042304 RepID=UPI001030F57B|nr:MFS transporter [Gracilibacillus phocaeensis]
MFKRLNRYLIFLLFTFLLLGTQTGVWAVLLADLVAAIQISESQIGIGLMIHSLIGLLSAYIGGKIADKVSRKVVLLFAFFGAAVFYIALTFIDSFYLLLLIFAVGGIFVSFYDLIANTLGGDYESDHNQPILTPLHACFSVGAAIGSFSTGILISSGVDYTNIYMIVALLLFLMGIAAIFVKKERKTPDEIVEEQVKINKKFFISLSILIPSLLIWFTFFIENALEGFLSLYLREALDFSSVMGGTAIGVFHVASLVGLLVSALVIMKWKQNKVLLCCGIIVLIGLLALIVLPTPLLTTVGLFLIGFALAPITPIAFSIASKISNQRRSEAVSIVTIFGYLAFLLAPLTIGILGDTLSLRVAFTLLIGCAMFIILLSLFVYKRKELRVG